MIRGEIKGLSGVLCGERILIFNAYSGSAQINISRSDTDLVSISLEYFYTSWLPLRRYHLGI